MNNIFITVYITNYNYGRYLNKCINSVLQQTFQNFELIIIDDGSTDESKKILERYQDKENIKIIFQDNIGLNCSNNVALNLSKGKYIIRVDADDYLMPNALELMTEIMSANDEVAMVFPDYYLIDSENNIIGQFIRHDFDNDVKLYDQPAHGACTMIKTDVLKNIGGYDEEFNRQDGYDIWLKITRNFKVKNVNEPLFYYRQHENSLSKNEFELLKTRAKIKDKQVKKLNLEKKKFIAIIPIKGNERSDRPLHFENLGKLKVIDWTINAALESEYISDTIISTNDEQIRKYTSDVYSDKVKVISRSHESYLPKNSAELAVSETIDKYTIDNDFPDYTIVLFINYPLRSSMYVDKAINTMRLFNVDAVDSIRLDNSLMYKHDGKGLKLFKEDHILKIERDEIYKRCGGLHLLKTENFVKSKNFFSGEIGHIIIDQKAALGIHTELDLKIIRSLI